MLIGINRHSCLPLPRRRSKLPRHFDPEIQSKELIRALKPLSYGQGELNSWKNFHCSGTAGALHCTCLFTLPLPYKAPRSSPLPKMRPFSLASIPRATRITTRTNPFFTQPRNFSFTQATMAVEKYTITEGSGPSPEKGQTVTMEYTGWLKDTSKPENKGKQYVLSTTPSYRSYLTFSPSRFDSSVGRGDFVVKIGVGQVIKGAFS